MGPKTKALLLQYCRPEIHGLEAQIIEWGYLIQSENRLDPTIRPDPEDTLRILEENQKDLNLNPMEEKILISAIEEEFF